MAIWLKIIIGGVIGMVAGGLMGYLGKCSSGACPLTANPFRGALVGALLGIAIALATGAAAFRGTERAADSTKHVRTEEDFAAQVLKADKPVLVDFYLIGCPPCIALAPTIQQLADEYKGRADVLKIDQAELPGIIRKHDIKYFPTVMLFSEGQVVERWEGFNSAEKDAPKYRAAIDAAISKAGKDMPMKHHAGTATFKGKPLTLLGRKLQVGDQAPDAVLLANDSKEVRISDYRGKVLVIASVPSLDTPVCDRETRRFNEQAPGLGKDVVILTVSMDLPFAQGRWCGAAGIKAVKTLSDHRDGAFGAAYGVLIKELRLLARAVFVVDREGVIRHIEFVEELSDEPDYGRVLDAIRKLG
jgi:thiol peroxidase